MYDWWLVAYSFGAMFTAYALNREKRVGPELFWTCIALWPLVWAMSIGYLVAVGAKELIVRVKRMMG